MPKHKSQQSPGNAQPTKTTTTGSNYYSNIVRRYNNDMMDYFIDDPDRKEIQPKYISAISKEFIYVKPQTNKQISTQKTVTFEFPSRDTLAISRTNKGVINVKNDKVQLKGVNTDDKKIISTPNYEGIKDEDNVFYLISLLPINTLNKEEYFSFNRWWIGSNPKMIVPIQGSNIIEKPQNNSTKSKELKVIEGKVQKEVPEIKKVETIEITKDQIIINNRMLKPKIALNKIELTL